MPNDASKRKVSRGFFYRTARKVRYLKHRGTLFHKTPGEIRHIRSLRRKRSRRHIFLFLRLVVFLRLRRRMKYRNEQILSGPTGYETFSGRSPDAPLPHRPKRKLSFSEKYRRLFRILRYSRRKKKIFREQQAIIRKRKKRQKFRVLFYLIRTGKFFRIDYKRIRAFYKRNYSFLGKSGYFVIILNSTVLFLLAYIAIYIAKEFATALAANIYQIRTILTYHDVNFLIRTGDWTPDKVEVVFSGGAFISFFICLISFVVYSKTTNESWPVRTFILWLAIQSFVQIFGEVMLGSLLTQGFGWVIAYIFYLDTPKLVISLVGFICLVGTGLALTRYLLYSGNIYFNKLEKGERMPFMMSQIILPYILGAAIIFAIKYPQMSQLDGGVILSMFFLLLPATVRARFSGNLYFDEEPRKIRLMWPWLLAALILIPAFRLVFGIGIRL